MKFLKRIAMAMSLVAASMLPIVSVSAADVNIESTMGVANVTAGDTSYVKSVNAKVDEVVKVQVWYHNMEEENSGKVATNLKVKIDLPTGPGKIQTIKSTVSADNSNSVAETATVNLSLEQAYLEYIPGSAQWRHNTGTNTNVNYVTETISDNVIAGGVVLEDAQPCFNFEATVTVLARVRANVVSIVKQVRKVGETNWVVANTANAGDTLEYLLTFKNEGNTELKNVAIGDNMPGNIAYVPGTTMLKNGANPSGIKITSDNITTGGIDVGNYMPGSVGYVWFKAKISSDLSAGTHKLVNVGVVRPEGMNEFYNTASTSVTVGTVTPPPPAVPVTPISAPLPEAGMEGAAAGALGTGIMGYAITAYRKSKRNLLDALRKVTR